VDRDLLEYAKPAELIRAAKKLDLEGIIAKRKGSSYEPGRRSGAWLKYKINRSQEFVIGGYTGGKFIRCAYRRLL
jgi:ATP-dependent DNA ligase